MSRRNKVREEIVLPTVAAPAGSPMAHLVMSKLKAMNLLDNTGNVKEEKESEAPVVPSTPPAGKVAIPVMRTVPTFEEQKRQVTERSLENQKYYLTQATRTGEPWFRHPRYEYQYSEFVYVTPEMAQQLRDHNDNTRSVTESQEDAYARDILNDYWIPTAESISIDVAGNMGDGQHRAGGIIKAQRAIAIYITFNVPVEAKFVQDSGKKRSVNEKLAILFGGPGTLNKKTPALCRAMMAGIRQRQKWTETEIAEFALKQEKAIRWVLETLPKQRSDVQAAFAKAYLWYGADKILDFCHALTNVEFKAGSPPSALYQWLIKIGTETTNDVVYRKTVQAIIYHAENKAYGGKLYEARDDFFEWGPGWSIPNPAVVPPK
jgi:hypothetical protein